MSSIPFYAKKFVSGINIEEAFAVVERLNDKKICVTLDLLGENISEKQQAIKFVDEYDILLKKISEKKLDCYVSIKLTMLGLDIDFDFCYNNLSQIMRIADHYNIRVALDMEGSDYTERTIVIYERAAKEFKNIEIVLQAYLVRTEDDVKRILAANGRVRLCKGAYKEPPEKAIKKMSQIVENYKKLIQKLLLEGQRICIASHDDDIIDFCIEFIEKNNIPKDRYEFQMLYGMREKTWSRIREKGHNMTIYVPYGDQWQAYYARRLAERKENVFFVLKNLFKS
ncbi:proline dehydrogenase family protein [Fluviispira sanaruensis]|uniref:proline dehydrogenase n=1 Tax=Fluviispira sanaruensis TaxID=2493639 RepID=A0A4P2VHS8_FLUSA|nr:proline dehydrogenase family protein [Fluviispira sanaruensis]BBH52496.1 proline dehydrogenase [Fluviispira sanaruensis]